MNSTSTLSIDSPSVRRRHTAVEHQIRGSSLLLAGRCVAMGMNFISQVLIVRYLSKSDYGALAYALSIVTLGQCISMFGLNRAVTRFLPIYHENRQFGKLFGTIFMVVGIVLSIGLTMALAFHALGGFIGQSWITDERAVKLLMVLVFLAPVQALDDVLLGLFAVFASPKSIFLRKHVLGPGLKLTVALLLILLGQDVFFVAGGYLIACILGVAIYSVVLIRLLRRLGILQHYRETPLEMPWREILTFTIPLLTSDLVHVVMHTVDIIVLERFTDLDQVALLRAVQPAALMNQVVMASFATLFMPLAARLYAKQDRQGINDLYWQTAIWIAVFSFPLFAITFSLAEPITVLVYGSRYAQSGTILAVLSLGCYFNAALGLNGLTLKVYGKLRYIVFINLAAVAVNLVAVLLLVPHFGALGAAWGTCLTLIAHNIFKHGGLRYGTDIDLFDRRYMRVYMTIVIGAVSLWAMQLILAPPTYVGLTVAACVSLAVIRLNRRALNAAQLFPEVLRLPLIRQLLG